MLVSSNGYITFGRGSSSLGYEPWYLFELPTIAALRGDLNPWSGGSVVVDETESHVAVTYLDVPWYSDPGTNSFQIFLRRSGNILVTYLDVSEGHGRYIAGIGNGCGTEAYPGEVDFVDRRLENCTDGVDNDGDGLADCADPECADDPDCRDLSRGYWEGFSPADPEDIEGYQITYTRNDANPNGYHWSIDWRGYELVEAPRRGEISAELDIRGDDFVEYPLTVCGDLRIFDTLYDRIFVSSNGYITFGEGSTSQSAEPELHFHLPSIAGYRADLDPLARGSVVVDEYDDHVTVTYETVPFWADETSSNTFQVSMYDDGSVIVHYAVLDGEGDVIIGISDGADAAIPPETNFNP
jgi:hypothetical protein